MTYDEYYALPDDGKRYEVIDGHLSLRPTPDIRHQTIGGNVLFALATFTEKYRTGEVFLPLDVVLSSTNVVQPDLLYVSDDRKHILTDECVRGAPDLMIEIIFEPTRERDEITKVALYERFGVAEYWIVDPEIDVVKIYRGAARVAELSLENDDVLTTALLPGLEIPLTKVFA